MLRAVASIKGANKSGGRVQANAILAGGRGAGGRGRGGGGRGGNAPAPKMMLDSLDIEVSQQLRSPFQQTSTPGRLGPGPFD